MHDAIYLVNSWLQHIAFDLQLDEDGNIIIQRDAQTALLLEVIEESETCHFYAPVTALKKYEPILELHTALEINQYGLALGGCWLAWDPEINMLCLNYNLYLPQSDPISFNNTLQNFLIAIDTARELLTTACVQYQSHQLSPTIVYEQSQI